MTIKNPKNDWKIETRGRKKKVIQPIETERTQVLDLTPEKIKLIEKARENIYIVQRDYQITTTKLLPHQLELKDRATETYRAWFNWSYIRAPKYKYVVFQSWNWAWKSFWLYYMISRYAIWKQAEKYKLEYIWTKKNIIIVTQSWANVRDYVEKYLLWDFSPTRIPPDLIEKVTRGSDHIKEIRLKNGCVITIKTVEQGQKRLVGSNPDLLVIDEPIEKDEVWWELLARLRWPTSQLLYWFTPINWYNSSYYFLYEQHDELIRRRTFIGRYSSLLNTTQDHSTLNAFDENQKAVRIYWEFMPKEWLVYNQFNRHFNVISKVPVRELWNCKYYCWLDVWVKHPTGITALAVDEDWNYIVFDEFKQSNLLVEDIAKKIKYFQTKHKIVFEKIIIDSAWQREKLELKRYWIICENARKQETWDWGEKNRVAWILRLNQYFSDRKLLIYDNCVELIKEIWVHSYKDWGKKDWEVNKINDDLLDWLRYTIAFLKPPKVIKELDFVTNYKQKYWIYSNKIKPKRERVWKTWS
jgi:hypothetical protein